MPTHPSPEQYGDAAAIADRLWHHLAGDDVAHDHLPIVAQTQLHESLVDLARLVERLDASAALLRAIYRQQADREAIREARAEKRADRRAEDARDLAAMIGGTP